MRFVFTCGGTAGHINPAIALAQCLQKELPDAELLFIGSGRQLENRLIPMAGFAIENVSSSGLTEPEVLILYGTFATVSGWSKLYSPFVTATLPSSVLIWRLSAHAASTPTVRLPAVATEIPVISATLSWSNVSSMSCPL